MVKVESGPGRGTPLSEIADKATQGQLSFEAGIYLQGYFIDSTQYPSSLIGPEVETLGLEMID